MKRLRYAPAVIPGRGKPPSKNALLRSQQRTTQLLLAVSQQNHYLERNLKHARAARTELETTYPRRGPGRRKPQP